MVSLNHDFGMGRAHKKVSISPAGIPYTPETAAADVEKTLKMLEGRWKLLILFQLFDGGIRRFSELERAIPAVTEKDGVIVRKIYPEIPPKVEYSLTRWGQSLCPALDALLKWSATSPNGPPPRLPMPLD